MELNEKMRSSGDTVMSAIVPLMKLLTLTVMGLILGNPKSQIIPRATFKLLSKLVFALFLPCLIFSELGASMTLESVVTWWFIPVNVLVSTAVGGLLGWLVVALCRPPRRFNRLVVVMTAFGNTGNVPLAVVGSVCHTPDNPFGPHCHSRGVAYVSFSQWLSVILVYTVVYHMMEPPMEFYEIIGDSDEARDEIVEVGEDDNGHDSGLVMWQGGAKDRLPGVHEQSSPLLVEAEWPGIEEKETEHSKTPFIARIFAGVSQATIPDPGEEMEEEEEERSMRCLAEPRVVRRIRIAAEQTPIRHILQPPTVASLLAIAVGTVPQLKSAFFGDSAPLEFVTSSLEIMGSATVPSVMLVLGGMLAEGPSSESAIGLRTVIGVTVARLLVLPVIGMGIVGCADRMGVLIAGDRMYRFVLMLQYTMPSAILLGAIASLRGYAVREASALIFWQHLFALFSLSFYIVIYFQLLSSV